MIALQDAQEMRIKRLAAQTDPGDAIFGQNLDLFDIKISRIRFDGEFQIGWPRSLVHRPEPPSYFHQQPFQSLAVQIRWRSTADEYGTNRLRLPKRGQFLR